MNDVVDTCVAPTPDIQLKGSKRARQQSVSSPVAKPSPRDLDNGVLAKSIALMEKLAPTTFPKPVIEYPALDVLMVTNKGKPQDAAIAFETGP